LINESPNSSASNKTELLALLEERAHRRARNRLENFTPYEWQSNFYAAGAHAKQRLLMAANRVGKTYSAAFEVACHLTGKYPDWWDGARFSGPIKCWALGVTGEQIRDVIQKNLLGEFDGSELDGKGAIPYVDIVQETVVRSPQTKNLVKDIKVWHKDGKKSHLSLKAYSQGQHVMMGDSVDLIWIDEEPTDTAIYPQCLTRTATGNKGKGGHVMMTFTPENGMTQIVSQFMEDLKRGQYLQNVTWDDAPHLDEATKEQILAAYPEYQRDMRSKGIPAVGTGLIFTVADEDIHCDPFELPEYFYVINGMDFGWDHPQAHIQLWWDKDQDVIYVAKAWKKSERDAIQAWTAVKPWSQRVPTAWPHDGLQHEKAGGEVLKAEYQKAGFQMLPEHATWVEGGLSVEQGIMEITQRMRDGKFLVFKTLSDWFEEKRLYHRDAHGRIVKERDDIISATRYAYMMRRYAIMARDLQNKQEQRTYIPRPIKPVRPR
jgi:phage terminase large subunit-like protein